MLVTLFIFYFEISGKDTNDEHLSNRHFISVKFIVFYLEISGNSFNSIQSNNK